MPSTDNWPPCFSIVGTIQMVVLAVLEIKICI